MVWKCIFFLYFIIYAGLCKHRTTKRTGSQIYFFRSAANCVPTKWKFSVSSVCLPQKEPALRANPIGTVVICMAVYTGLRWEIGEIFIFGCHLPVAAECDIVILSESVPNLTGSSWAVLQTQLIPARGRKPNSSVFLGSSFNDTTYPREGTETGPLYQIYALA